MRIIGTMEIIESGELEFTTAEAEDYLQGAAAMRRTLPEGVRLLAVRVER